MLEIQEVAESYTSNRPRPNVVNVTIDCQRSNDEKFLNLAGCTIAASLCNEEVFSCCDFTNELNCCEQSSLSLTPSYLT